MSLEDARNKLTSARQDLHHGRESAIAGHEASDTALSQYATASEHRNKLASEARRLMGYLESAQGAMVTYRSETKRAADLEHTVHESAQKATTNFSVAAMHAGLARNQVASVFGSDEANMHLGPPVDHSTRAARSASVTSTRSQAAEERLRQYADRLKKLTQELGELCMGVDKTTYEICHAHDLSDPDPSPDSFKVPLSLDELNQDAAVDPANLYEEGAAAITGFDGAMSVLGRHLRNIG